MQQLDLFEYEWKCSEDVALYQKVVEKKRVFKFLLGLNKNLDEVRGRVLATKPLPSLSKAFFEVQREKRRKKVMLGTPNPPPQSDVSALSIHGGSALATQGFQQSNLESQRRKGRPFCDHYRKPGHTKDTCWKLHGKPANWKPSKF